MSKMQEKVQELGVAEHVRFLGVRSDVADLMQAMDVFVFPSLYEGLGIALIEAQAAGLPCVVSDTIPHEAYLTDLVDSESLSAPAEKWAERSLRSEPSPAPTSSRNRRARLRYHYRSSKTTGVLFGGE